MRSNRIIWVMVVVFVSVTMAITLGTFDGRSQKAGTQSAPTPENTGYKDRSRYAVADYDESLPVDAKENQKRRLANCRYDGQDWVVKNPHPDDGGVGREDELTPPPLIPTTESALIIVGEITESHAHMSNDKFGIYTEFSIQVKQILKNDAVRKIVKQESVIADRMGGYVRYPNGQKVFYENSTKVLPEVGKEYVFFLTNDKQSPNYEILTLYELKGDSIVRLDSGRNFDEYKDAGKASFVEAIKNKISQLSRPSR